MRRGIGHAYGSDSRLCLVVSFQMLLGWHLGVRVIGWHLGVRALGWSHGVGLLGWHLGHWLLGWQLGMRFLGSWYRASLGTSERHQSDNDKGT